MADDSDLTKGQAEVAKYIDLRASTLAEEHMLGHPKADMPVGVGSIKKPEPPMVSGCGEGEYDYHGDNNS